MRFIDESGGEFTTISRDDCDAVSAALAPAATAEERSAAQELLDRLWEHTRGGHSESATTLENKE